MRVAVWGHRQLDEATASEVDQAIRQHLATVDRLVGLTCLADGADRIFAKAVLEAGGQLRVVVPAEGHREQMPATSRHGYDALLRRAIDVVNLRFGEPSAEAYLAAARHMLERADQLVAVWNRKAADTEGGPVDVIREAVWRRVPVKVIWPADSAASFRHRDAAIGSGDAERS